VETFLGNLANLLDGRQKALQPYSSQQVRFMFLSGLTCGKMFRNVGGVPTKVPTVRAAIRTTDRSTGYHICGSNVI
jgi:hypothetical protein